ncbi:hypothetical protein HK100_003192 [Physocladia obscura]|uniref:NAD(P)-binding domain-containing protein n=1 Tax=Physocladia obscura TaxID=109957 RepID=A0AAD5T0A9_9FUNG|nr:hypothetical protein HK100_003192 [Physocladia obscura]
MSTFLVFGATGGTGKHFVEICLANGHTVRALVRTPAKLGATLGHERLAVTQGSIGDAELLEPLVRGADYVVCMVGDAAAQQAADVNAAFVRTLVPLMRRLGVARLLYQAGALSRHYRLPLPAASWLLRNTLARSGGLLGQHRDNEAVIQFLFHEAQDIEWIVHRAAIIYKGPSRGVLVRSESRSGLAAFVDIAEYNYRAVQDPTAVHTCDLSVYQ